MNDPNIVAEVLRVLEDGHRKVFQRDINRDEIEEVVKRPIELLHTEIDQTHQRFTQQGWNYDRVGWYVGMLSFVLGMRVARGERL